jgi:hypothetical protein
MSQWMALVYSFIMMILFLIKLINKQVVLQTLMLLQDYIKYRPIHKPTVILEFTTLIIKKILIVMA